LVTGLPLFILGSEYSLLLESPFVSGLHWQGEDERIRAFLHGEEDLAAVSLAILGWFWERGDWGRRARDFLV